METEHVAYFQWMQQLSRIAGDARLGDFAELERDSVGQVRPVYRYFAMSCRLRSEGGSPVARGWAEEASGKTVLDLAWRLWLGVLQKDSAVVDLLADRLRGVQQADGRWHELNAETNLDGFVFDELCVLHALGNAAIRTRRGDLAEMVHRGCLYHLENTQPDNSTNQPWALAAFGMHGDTLSFAEQQAHDCYTHWVNSGQSGKGGPSLVVGLAADALEMLKELNTTTRDAISRLAQNTIGID